MTEEVIQGPRPMRRVIPYGDRMIPVIARSGSAGPEDPMERKGRTYGSFQHRFQ